MPPIRGLNIDPPLLNSSCPWASTFEQLSELYQCKSTGAVTTRTATMSGFDEDPGTHTVAFARDRTTSINSYGYSPHPLATYLEWIETLLKSQNSSGKVKPIILSIAPMDAQQLGAMMATIQGFRLSPPNIAGHAPQYQAQSNEATPLPLNILAIELNTSCPNIPGHPPPAYDIPTLTPLLQVLADTFQRDSTLVIGLKLAPYVHRGQMEDIVGAIATLTDEQGRNPIAFLTCTNTLGGCVMFAEQASGVDGTQKDQSTANNVSQEGKLVGMALPTTFGGLDGEPLHYLSLGNVMTLSGLLASSPIPALRRIGIVGVGGVTSHEAYQHEESRSYGGCMCYCVRSKRRWNFREATW